MPSLPTLDLHKSADGVSKPDFSKTFLVLENLLLICSCLCNSIRIEQLQCDALESPCHVSGIKEEVRFAACDLVCEWAQKVLKRQFDAVEDLARFLIDSHYISNKSLAALTLMTGAATAPGEQANAAERWGRHLVAATCYCTQYGGPKLI